MKKGEYLRLHFPVEGLNHEQRARAVEIGNRVETLLAALLAQGADPDRVLAKLESYFPSAGGS